MSCLPLNRLLTLPFKVTQSSSAEIRAQATLIVDIDHAVSRKSHFLITNGPQSFFTKISNFLPADPTDSSCVDTRDLSSILRHRPIVFPGFALS